MFIISLIIFILCIVGAFFNILGGVYTLPNWLRIITEPKILLPISIISFVALLVFG